LTANHYFLKRLIWPVAKLRIPDISNESGKITDSKGTEKWIKDYGLFI